MKFIRKHGKQLLIALTVLSALVFLGSCMSPYVNPNRIALFAFLGLGFFVLLIINFGWLTFWLVIRRPKYALIPLLVIIVSIPNLMNLFSISGSKTVPAGEQPLSLMSYNVKTFDLYNWSNNVDSKNHMLGIIQQELPDVLCLQEFYTNDFDTAFNTLKTLKQWYPYYNFHETLGYDDGRRWGLATFSKHPIVNSRIIDFEGVQHNLCLFTSLKVGDDTLQVYNAHLQSIHFDHNDYQTVENPGNQAMEAYGNVFSKLRYAFGKRADQAVLLKKHINSETLPVVVCGDFNDTPNSYAYRTLSKGMHDSFKHAGTGWGQTYTGPAPSFRIDFVLGSRQLQFYRHDIIKEAHSDHYPVMATFSVE